MRAVSLAILFIFIGLQSIKIQGQTLAPSGIRLFRITYLTNTLDSLTRSFIKRGYHVKSGKREPKGIFSNIIIFPNGCEIVLESMIANDKNNWRLQALRKYGNHISGIAFETDQLSLLEDSLRSNHISLTSFGARGFALDSCAPLDIVFLAKDTSRSYKDDSLAYHSNNVFRFDWVLLSAGSIVEQKLRSFFNVIHARKLHEGCCDFWRLGPSNDFCFFRFEPLPPKAKGKKDWISVESENIYFAY